MIPPKDSYMHPKNIRAYLDSAAGIAALLPQAERLVDLRRLYQGLVPQQLLRSSSIVNYKQGNVVIFAENNAVAAKLKLLSPRLVNDFLQNGFEVTGIRVEVQPRETPPEVPAAKRAKLSRGAAGCLKSLAERLPDSKLKQAVKHMAEQAGTASGPDEPGRGDQDPRPSRRS